MLFIKNNNVYDALKFVAQLLLPALGTLYFALAQIWGLPHGEQIVGTIVAVDAFLGVVLGLSSAAYNNSDARFDGEVTVIETDEKKLFSIDIPGDPNDLDQKSEVTLKVTSSQETG